jgi:protein phosphatase
MGGHRGGEVASQMAVSIAGSTFERTHTNDPTHPRELLQSAAREANSQIMKRSQTEKELEGMGTTLTMLHVHENTILVGHVGDSRCYLIRNEGIWQITRDHSLVQEKLRAGMITRDQLKTDRMKNVITRSVGFEAEVEIDLYQINPNSGDLFLLCSDGLSGMIEDTELSKILDKHLFDENQIEVSAQALIETANKNGGDDNVTALLVQVL